ncbi:RidA family protein [Maricaulis sp.]|uniref:RidA family protein n=1 Tax=Maricaulis sp. TaxID=1486257 RepID=UPI0025C62790|nr:RidA family protein [Maricaulis sp.]
MDGVTRRSFTGASWENQVGYCRAIRRGNLAWVTGTVSLDAHGQPFAVGDPEAQARRCFEIIGKALDEVGGALTDIVRTRMFVTDIDHWEAFGRAHAAVFKDHPPATTMVEISRFIGPDFLIEIEADACIEAA